MKRRQAEGVRTLVVDIGGSGIKALTLDAEGRPVSERSRTPTPRPATPDAVLPVIVGLAEAQERFDRVTVGFPGIVRHGVIYSAVNLDDSWDRYDLAGALGERLGQPVRVANDADVQGFGAISGVGLEMVLTLGTGMGSAIFIDGRLVPNLELGHHPFEKTATYEDRLGSAALDRVGVKKWNRRLERAIALIERVFNFDRLYLGGGNAKKIRLALPEHVLIVSNIAGLIGGIALWRDSDQRPDL